MDRREFVQKSLLFTAAIIVPSRSVAAVKERRIQLYNIHTGEHIDALFWMDGEYVYEELSRLEYFLRDYRNNAIHPIDVDLIEYLYALHQRIGTTRSFEVLSAYRSPQTNEYLRRHMRGVAKKSYHTQGKAVDITLRGFRLSTLKYAALSLRRGGVGYYPRSHFIHIDTGKPRYWRYPKR